MKGKSIFILACGILLLCVWPVQSDQQQDCFRTSLHHTTRGMATWYDADNGFSAITNVPYKDLGCKNCHATSCNDCHLEKSGEGFAYSTAKARRSSTCLKCHAREKATIGIDTARNSLGVHIKAGMQCADCHSAKEVHGDGTCYESMRAPGAMDTACTNCHTEDSTTYPAIPPTESHMVHSGKLDCTACHVENSMTCYNCHFGVLQKTKSKPKSMVTKTKDFLLLVKYNGKFMSGTMQTLVGPDNYPFVAYVPYFTHSVTEQGRKCESCHSSRALKELAAGKSFNASTYKDGKLSFFEGVIPVVPDRINWTFLEKAGEQWTPFEPPAKPLVQMAVYAEPFTDDELEMMNMEQVYTGQ